MSLSTAPLVLALSGSVAASVAVALLRWLKRRSNFSQSRYLSSGWVIASDTGIAPPRTICDRRTGLRGRPDYLLAQGHGEALRIVPLELKPQRRSRRLYESDAVQLGVYLLAARATYGVRASRFGLVRYASTAFRVELTEALEKRVLEVVTAIRAGRGARLMHRSHEIPARCARCPVRRHCDEALV